MFVLLLSAEPAQEDVLFTFHIGIDNKDVPKLGQLLLAESSTISELGEDELEEVESLLEILLMTIEALEDVGRVVFIDLISHCLLNEFFLHKAEIVSDSVDGVANEIKLFLK